MNKLLLATSLALVSAVASHGAAFTPGNLVIYRVGDGSIPLANTGNSVFLDEYNVAGGLVQSIPVPNTATVGGNQALIASGTASSEGALSLSGDGRFLAFTGYNSAVGANGNLSGTASATVNRTVGLAGANGVVNTTSTFTDFATANNPRTAYTPDGMGLYFAGGAGGIRYAAAGTTGGTSTQLSTTTANLRGITAAGGQLYVSSSSGTTRLATVGTGTPTTAGQTIANLPGISTANSTSPYAFSFADLSATVAGPDTLYVADDTANTGGIQKFTLSAGGTWSLTGTITAAAGVRGLALTTVGTTVSLFATTGAGAATGGGTLYGVVDPTGYNGDPTALPATALATLTVGSNQAFRGIAFAPAVPEPSTVAILLAGGLGAVGLARRRLRRQG